MKEGWKYESFCNVFPIRMGKTPPRADKEMWDANKKTKNLWVSVADITSNEGQDIISTKEHISELAAQRMHIVPKGYLLMSFKLTIGKMAFAGKDLFTNEAIIAIPKNDKYNLRFLYYYLSSYNWDTLTTGAEKVKGKTLNKSSIGKIQLPIIPLSEQERIVSLLDAQFAKIDAIKANAEKQLQDAKKTFSKCLNEIIAPSDEWENNMLCEICQVINGRAYKQDEMLSDGKYRLLRVGNFFTNDKWYYSNLELEEKKYCDTGDLLYAWSASFGPKIWHGGKVIYHYHIWKMICSPCIDKKYMYYWLETDLFKKQVMRDLHGATMNHITKAIMEATIVKYPPLQEQYDIVAKLDILSAKIQSLQSNYDQTVTLCNDLKQSLLKDIFS